MGKYEYLSAIVPYTILIYLLFVCCFVCIFHYCSCARKPRTNRDRAFIDTVLAMNREPKETILYKLTVYFEGDSFETTYQSCWGKWGTYLLLFTRLASFCYICGINVIIKHTIDPMFSPYFTAWNVDILAFYFLLATIASILGISCNIGLRDFQDSHIGHEANAVHYWSKHSLRFGYLVQIVYEIAGPTAFFVTVISFVLLNPRFEFWNVSVHFITSMTILLEMFLNNINVRWEHMLLNLAWALIYLIFCWPMVSFGALQNWPYFFLRTSSSFVFVWYIILIVVDIFFFFVFWTLSLLKYLYLRWKEGNTDTRLEAARYPNQHGGHPQGLSPGDIEMSHDQIYGSGTL